MNLHHVIFEALYEIKLTRRNLLFNMFVFFCIIDYDILYFHFIFRE